MPTNSLDITFPGNLAQVADAATLRAVPTSELSNDSTYLVSNIGLFDFDPSSLAPDNGKSILKPNALTPLQAGRWVYIGIPSIDQAALDAGIAAAAGKAGFAYDAAYPNDTIGNLLRKARGIDVTQPPYNADPADIGPAIMAAAAANPGRYLYLPAGQYDLVTPVVQRLTGAGFLPSLRLFGDGVGVTVINSRVVNASAIDVDTATHGSGPTAGIAYGFHLSGLTLKWAAGANASGVTLRNSYQPLLEDVYVSAFSGSGVRLITTIGDPDANNQPTLRRVRIDNCKIWGLDAPGGSGSGGANESSYLTLENVFIQNCGTDGTTSVPETGGMRWKGQILLATNLAFTLNFNCALYVPNDGKTGQGISITNLTLENNRKRGLFVRDIFNCAINGLQIYQNTAFPGTVGVEFDASTGIAQNIDIRQSVVRVSHGLAYDAFVLGGANVDWKSCHIEPPKWFNFDHVAPGTGQRRFVGWRFPNVRQCGILVVASASTLVFQQNPAASPGHTTPLRLRGPLIDPGEGLTGVASTTGEWVAMDFGNGVALLNTEQTDEGATPTAGIYNVYLYEMSNVLRIRLSKTATAIDPITGYTVKMDDWTKLFIGRVELDANGFKTTAGGYLNAMLVTGSQVGTFGRIWWDGAGKLRGTSGAGLPTSDADGVIIGTQIA